jgi:hypothetical protein
MVHGPKWPAENRLKYILIKLIYVIKNIYIKISVFKLVLPFIFEILLQEHLNKNSFNSDQDGFRLSQNLLYQTES